ncbi:MAG: PKD domain-containing protein [Bacteroidota bacterium]
MKFRIPFLILGILLLGIWGWFPLTAHEETLSGLPEPDKTASDLRFIENQGQWDDRIAYKVRLNGGNILFEQNRLTYDLYEMPGHLHGAHNHGVHDHGAHAYGAYDHEGEQEEEMFKQHAFRMTFPGASQKPTLLPGLKFDSYHNYFQGNDPSKWKGGVPLYGLLTYQELYDKIDLRFYGWGDAVKYDFIVRPGGKVSDIAIAYEGIDKLYLKKGKLHLQTTVRELTEMAPVAYQLMGGEKVPVPCRFKLKKKTVTYEFPEGYDEAYPLVIDPTLIFSTYTGSPSDNWGFTATYDTAGHAYAGGILFGGNIDGDYPLIGAYQSVFGGGSREVTISKISPDGTNMVYSTYLGGLLDDQPHSMVVSESGELVVMGRTNSPDFPTFNAYDPSHNGQFDIFVARFTANGQNLIGSTFIGGTLDDGVNGDAAFNIYTDTKYNYGDDARGEVILDEAGNVYVAAPTNSANFPIVGGFQSIKSTGQDGCIIKLSPSLNNIIWSSFFGGSGEDAIHTIKLDDSENVFVAGGTSTSNLITSGGFDLTYGGATDGFIAKINNAGSAILNATFLGTPAYDQVYSLDLDRKNNVYVAGQTNGTWYTQSPPSGPVYVNPGANQFIVKMTNDLTQMVYATTIGSANATHPNISPTAFLVDRCDNVYLTGWGGNTNSNTQSPNLGNTTGMPITADAYQSGTDGSDFYMVVLDRDAQNLVYGSYFGGNSQNGDHVDGGTSRFDKNGVVYHAVCASCGGTNAFPAVPGNVVSNTNNSSNCNLAVFKMSFDLAGIEAQFEVEDENNQPLVDIEGCAPLTVNFNNLSNLGNSPGSPAFFWDFDDNGANSALFEPSYTFQDSGFYEVMLIIIDSLSCNIRDTTYQTVRVNPPPEVQVGPDLAVCLGDTFQLTTITSGVSYAWSPDFTLLTSDTLPNPVGLADVTRDYILTLTDTNGCQATDTLNVFVDDTFNIQGRVDTTICRGGTIQLGAFAAGAVSYTWLSDPPVAFSNPNVQAPTVANLDSTTRFFVMAENVLGCEVWDTIQIDVFEVFTLEDTFICRGQSILLASQNGISFEWTPDDGSLDNAFIASPTASPVNTTTYTVTARSAAGCISVKDIEIEVKDLPVATVGGDPEICIGDTAQLSGSGAVNLAWTPNFFLDDPTIGNPQAFPPTTTTYTLTVTDGNGCQDADSITLTVHPLPVVDAGLDTTICQDEATNLLATGAISYVWSPTAGLSDPGISNPVASPPTTTNYQVTGTDINGCQNTDEVEVNVIPPPITRITGINNICLGGEIELTASGGDRYVWSTGETTETIFVLPGASQTTYYATAYVGACEGIPDSIVVDEFFGFPVADFEWTPTDNLFAPEEITFTNLTTGASTYIWDFGYGNKSEEENPVFVYPSAGTFQVMLIAFSAQGCPDTAIYQITLDNVTLHVPSGFTPNGDDLNQEWQVGYIGIRTMQVEVFSRWGMKVYESDNPDFRWDGTYKGEPVPEGVYVYVIRGIGENDLNYLRKGTVTLIR